MNQLLEKLGAIAGIGGISLGVFLFLFRGILSLKIFPKMEKEKAYLLLRSIIVFSFVTAVTGIGAYTVIQTHKINPSNKADIITNKHEPTQTSNKNPGINHNMIVNKHGVQNNITNPSHKNDILVQAHDSVEKKFEELQKTGKVVSIGIGTSQDMGIAEKIAQTDALSNFASNLSAKIKSTIKYEVSSNKNVNSINFNALSQQIVNISMQGLSTYMEKFVSAKSGTYTCFVIVGVNIEKYEKEIKSNLEKSLKIDDKKKLDQYYKQITGIPKKDNEH